MSSTVRMAPAAVVAAPTPRAGWLHLAVLVDLVVRREHMSGETMKTSAVAIGLDLGKHF